ncbi:MAG TPA: AraC family transcriptional regulator [Trebonia sp.]
MSVLIDTNRLDPRERSDALQAVLTRATAPHDLTLLGPTDEVHARLEHWQLNSDVALLQQTSSGVSHTRTRAHGRHDGPERVVFVLHSGGPGSYVHDGSAYRLNRGGLYVTDLNSCYSYTRPGDGAARIVQVERSALGLTAEQVQSASAHLPESPFYDLLRGHIAEVCAIAPSLSGTQSEALAAATAHLARTMLRAAVPTSGTRQHGPDCYLIDRTVLFMRKNFGRPELAAKEIAHQLGVSERYLFQRWSGQPRTLAETLLDIRLNAARHLLGLPPALAINVIAHRCGFADPSHFSRCFRRAHGMSPTEYRRLAVRLNDETRASSHRPGPDRRR